MAIPALPQIPGLEAFDHEGHPIWAPDDLDQALDEALADVDVGDRARVALANVALTLCHALTSAEALALIDLYRLHVERELGRHLVLEAQGLTVEVGKTWERAQRVAELRADLDRYRTDADLWGWPADPAELDDETLGQALVALDDRRTVGD